MANFQQHQRCDNSLQPFFYVYDLLDTSVIEGLCNCLQIVANVDEYNAQIVKQVARELSVAVLITEEIENSITFSEKLKAPSAHVKYGVDQAINASNYGYFIAVETLTKLQTMPKAMEIYTEEMLRLHRGRGQALFWRESTQVPKSTDNKTLIIDKTAPLFRMAARLLLECGLNSTLSVETSAILEFIEDLCYVSAKNVGDDARTDRSETKNDNCLRFNDNIGVKSLQSLSINGDFERAGAQHHAEICSSLLRSRFQHLFERYQSDLKTDDDQTFHKVVNKPFQPVSKQLYGPTSLTDQDDHEHKLDL